MAYVALVDTTSTTHRTLGKRTGGIPGPKGCRRKFLRYFPGGYHDEKYVDWERSYKWRAHQEWETLLSKGEYATLLRKRAYSEIAAHAIRIESRTNLLFSFEKMALRDAVRSAAGARAFAQGLYDFLYGDEPSRAQFERWCEVVEGLPRKQTRVLTWPVVTVFGFVALPRKHIFLKPNVTRIAAEEYGYDFRYTSRPMWETYRDLLRFAKTVRDDTKDLRPRDLIDIQSFLWVQGSVEYP